ncbi:MAG: hypothetical protein HYV78_01210 [Candidatus Wildermuthbacteria bacterium]|nr:hypothetical protein [Candidatus Wildermuthbacteria bacterium]
MHFEPVVQVAVLVAVLVPVYVQLRVVLNPQYVPYETLDQYSVMTLLHVSTRQLEADSAKESCG